MVQRVSGCCFALHGVSVLVQIVFRGFGFGLYCWCWVSPDHLVGFNAWPATTLAWF